MSTQTKLPPGPSTPKFVQAAAWQSRPWSTLGRCRERYGETFRFEMPHEGTWVFLSDPDSIKQVFTGDPRLLHAGEGNVILLPVLGPHSVLLLDDDRHLSQRKLLLPPFHGERMQRYGEIMTQATLEEIERWPTGRSMELAPPMKAITLEVIMRAVFGVDDDHRHDQLAGMLRDLLSKLTSPSGFLLPTIIGPQRAAKLLRSQMRAIDVAIVELIQDRRRDPSLHEREDILSLLLCARHEDGEPMSDVELRDELMTLLVAGHETTANALSWAFERLVRTPHAMERLVDEIDAGEDTYLDAVVTETLRLRPVISLVARRLVEPMEIAGYNLPAGVTVAPCIYLMHRRADIYPDPHAFKPERFLDSPPKTYTWIPFGGGVRRCIGASFAQFEMKAVIRAVLAQTTLRAARPEPESSSHRAITHVPARGAEVVVERRRTKSSQAPEAAVISAA